GKTTLANAIREAAIDGVVVPQRFVTRAPRADDVAAEADYVMPAALDALIARGVVSIYWSRTFEPGHVERYGFESSASGFPVYSANNAICADVRAHAALGNALFVGVYAADSERGERLRGRSPALFADRPDEARARLEEASDAMRAFVHVIVDNGAGNEAAAQRDIVTLVRNALSVSCSSRLL
ncbi:MAG TPA: hypothetical protein VMZ53_12375, partial [Kofleriaceae bacterium]|nr:hypothetical protein [Kofleriaceae bacterium]